MKFRSSILLPVTYSVVAGPPYRDVELKFLWPVTVLANKKNTIMLITILETNIDVYLPKGERAFSMDRDLDEETILGYLTSNMPEAVTLNRADLIRALKHCGTRIRLTPQWVAGNRRS